MTTMAELDPETQENATGVFNMFTAMYRVPPNLFKADEIGAAVQAAAQGQGSADPGFTARLWDGLLPVLYKRMSEYAARGEDLPSGLAPAQYAVLRKGLVSRFGPLPAAAPPEPEPAAPPDAPVDTRSVDEQMADMLRAKAPSQEPIDPEVLRVLRG